LNDVKLSNVTDIKLTDLTIVDNEEPDSVTINLQLPEGNITLHDNDIEFTKKLNQILCDPDIKSELGEQIIWNSNFEEGIFWRKIRLSWIITNYRVIYSNFKTGEFLQIPLKYLDVVVMNTHSAFQSQGFAMGAAMPGSLAIGAGMMQRKGTSVRVGDLVFIVDGQVLLKFSNVFDPSGVKNLINQVKKQMYGKK